MKKVLVCEDEESIRDFVVINLKRSGYDVVDVCCGEDALKAFENEDGGFDVALLDIMMPGIDGMQVCKKFREQNETMGIIMLSAKSQEMDKISSLMMGADDYITKPFSISELIARVDAVCRRVSMVHSKAETASVINSGPFTLNLKSRTVFKNGVQIDLTQTTKETLLNTLKRETNFPVVQSALNKIGITDFDLRLKGKEKDDTNKAIDEIKEKFAGANITVKP